MCRILSRNIFQLHRKNRKINRNKFEDLKLVRNLKEVEKDGLPAQRMESGLGPVIACSLIESPSDDKS
jgi:hypothetical protein